ncbi:MAG: hypothetical protein NDP22_01450, partial [Crenarchaeota archaeon]|nr:hypothetical protein [Thermoproteota archaeon]
LLVFPELANSGYNFKSREDAWRASETIPEGRTIKLLEKLSQEYSIYVVSGINERHEDKLYNSAVLVGPNGFIGTYRKVHLFMNEKDIFERGREFFVFETKIARIGIMICFDWIFPEATRTLVLKGAEIICHPANLVLPYWQKLCGLRALENRVYIVTANRVGIEGNLNFTGRSIIVDPKGEIITEASRTHEELIYADIDVTLSRDKNITPRNNIFEDRLPEAYVLF